MRKGNINNDENGFNILNGKRDDDKYFYSLSFRLIFIKSTTTLYFAFLKFLKNKKKNKNKNKNKKIKWMLENLSSIRFRYKQKSDFSS